MRWNEKEILIGKNKMQIIEGNIVHITAIGDIDEELTKEIMKLYEELMERMEQVKMLFDLNRAGKVSPQARKLFTELARDKRILKVASFGLHPVARVIATFGMGSVYGKGFARFFKTEEEAVAWLKE
ncbi:STAS/SEC14 domain-containing protein [candidate division WOR-3 bacterium]|nr:STAS/SEC14 domain-containing protein [candidate division WOR-3 bacterium]